VDNAIVVVEAVHSKMEQDPSLSPYDATQKAMGELGGAIIAITLVMISVFCPIAFMSGPVGVFYRQFSITMASSIIISGVVALTLTPVLCAMILRNHAGHAKSNNLLNRCVNQLNVLFDKLTQGYMWLLDKIISKRVITFSILILFLVGIF